MNLLVTALKKLMSSLEAAYSQLWNRRHLTTRCWLYAACERRPSEPQCQEHTDPHDLHPPPPRFGTNLKGAAASLGVVRNGRCRTARSPIRDGRDLLDYKIDVFATKQLILCLVQPHQNRKVACASGRRQSIARPTGRRRCVCCLEEDLKRLWVWLKSREGWLHEGAIRVCQVVAIAKPICVL